MHRSSTASSDLDVREPELLVADIMTRDVAVVRETDTLAFASQILLWRNIRHLVVVNADDEVKGMLSDRDLVAHVIEGPAGVRPVSDFMATNVQTMTPEATVAEASATMREERIDALPILAAGKLVGILTTSDILSARGRALRRSSPGRSLRVKDVMHRRVISAKSADSLSSAIEKLLDQRIRHLPVVDDNFRVIGMLSDRDIRTAVGDPRKSLQFDGWEGGALEDVTVGSVMTRDSITVSRDASIFEVARIFVDEKVGALPVVRDDDTLVGIVSYVDALAHFIGRGRGWNERGSDNR